MTSTTTEGRTPRLPNSILLVDDDDDSREFLGELLQGRGFDVHLAQHGREALSMLHDLPRPCTVLLDLNMPQVSGEAVLRTLAETATADAFPVIVVSGDDKVIGVPYPNIVARLSKPFELGVLERALAKVARGHDAPGMTPTAIPLVDDGRAHSAVFRFR